MRILFDQGVPAPLRLVLEGHTIATAYEMGWAELQNGELLRSTENEFDALVTTDQSLRYQQNLAGRRLTILVLLTTSWPRIKAHEVEVAEAVAGLRPGLSRAYCLGWARGIRATRHFGTSSISSEHSPSIDDGGARKSRWPVCSSRRGYFKTS